VSNTEEIEDLTPEGGRGWVGTPGRSCRHERGGAWRGRWRSRVRV